jgi:hypothetical protein
VNLLLARPVNYACGVALAYAHRLIRVTVTSAVCSYGSG